MLDSTAKYERVGDGSDERLLDDDTESHKHTSWPSRVGLSDALLVISVIVAFLSLALSVVALNRRSDSLTRGVGPTTGALRRPNAYIGLEKVDFSAHSSFPVITGYPLATFQVQVGDPQRILNEDDRRYTEANTTVVPDVRHIVISNARSTIVQFRAMDWGMEDCVLHLHIPTDASAHKCTRNVDVWDLDGPELLPHIAWKRAPERRSLFGTFPFVAGETAGQLEFTCHSGSFPTLEFAPAQGDSDGCDIDFWQGQPVDDFVLHLKQHWSRGKH